MSNLSFPLRGGAMQQVNRRSCEYVLIGLVVVLLGASVGCAGQQGEVFSSQKGWKTLGWGDNAKTSGGEDQILTWRFKYNNEPSVLTRKASKEWKAFRTVSFEIMSDREGPLFLRLDQKDKKIFLTPFNVTTGWSTVTLSPDDFSPFGGASGTVVPAMLRELYLVDLQGKDEGARGDRTVTFRNVVFNASATVSPMSQRRMTRTGTTANPELPLVAFDKSGRVMDEKDFIKNGTSGQKWCYLKPLNGHDPLELRIGKTTVQIDGRKVKVPFLKLSESIPASLEIFFWDAGPRYKLWLAADGQGRGIQFSLENGILLLNRELTLTRLASLKEYLTNSGIGRYDRQIAEISARIDDADGMGSLRERAAVYDSLLENLLEISENAVRDYSRERVAADLAPGGYVTLPVPVDIYLNAGDKLTIKLEEPAFLTGVAQSFGFLFNKDSTERITSYYSGLRQRGFNTFVLPLFWDQVVTDSKSITDWEDRLKLNLLVDLDYSLIAHGLIQHGMPQRAKKLKKEKFHNEAVAHLYSMSDYLKGKYGQSIVLWEVINEPTSNSLGSMNVAGRANMISDLIGVSRRRLPGMKMMVNDYDWERGIETGRSWEQKNLVSTLSFYEKLLEKNNRPDVLGLEWYPGARVDRPEFRVDMAEPCRDLLDTSLYWDQFTDLGLSLILTESNFPGSMKRNDTNGYAWGRWSESSQAEAAVDTLFLALSKPGVIGWNWWSITDAEPWNRDGGLYTAGGSEKEVLLSLSKAIQSLKKPVVTRVTRDISAAFPAMAGRYRISLQGGRSWTVHRSESGEMYLGEQ